MKCAACQSNGPFASHDIREMLHGFHESFVYQECGDCGTLQIASPPQDLSRYYPPNYYSYSSVRKSNLFPILDWLGGKRDAYLLTGRGRVGRCLDFIRPVPRETHPLRSIFGIGLNKTSRILDVGCGSGQQLFRLSYGGFRNLLGVDPFLEGSIQYRNGLQILPIGLEQVKGTWDLIMMHHSFEHMPDAASILAAVRPMLDPNGYCLIRIPTVSSYAWRHYGKNWASIDAPRHFTLFSRSGFRLLIERHGFEIATELDDSGIFQFLGSELYQRGIPWSQRGDSISALEIQSKATLLEYSARSQKLNEAREGDQVAYLLRLAGSR